jgi:glutamyl-tRNA synthetase
MNVVTRFAPSPTGFLHIGSARTALFNWLYARHHGGKFLLRIEDTDRDRSTNEAIKAIIEGLKWLELDWDDNIIFQFARAARHQEAAHALVAQGKAYYCFCTPQELEEMREKARAEGRQPRYNGYWRDRSPHEAPSGVRPVIRLKVPEEGETIIQDLVQGEIRVQNAQLDDMVLLRADQTPTYMLAVVVDDYEMNISHVIRGDDHLTNTFRQLQIYEAMGWNPPLFSHIPLIHGEDGAKLSKRHGALGVEAYRDMGFVPEAMCNYLLRLGWGHGDDEIISRTQAVEWFDIKDVGRSASRFDMAKLTSVNAHYVRERNDEDLVRLVTPILQKISDVELTELLNKRLLRGMSGLKQRARTLQELAENALFLIHSRPLPLDEKAQKILADSEVASLLRQVLNILQTLPEWEEKNLEEALRTLAESLQIKMGALAQPLRAALTGQSISPGIFDVMITLGREESLERIQDVLKF